MSTHTKGAAMEGQLSFSFEIGCEVDGSVVAIPAKRPSTLDSVHVAPVICISSRRIAADKRGEIDAYTRVMLYARSLRQI